MKFRLSKRFVFNDLQYRIFAVLILAVSVSGVKYWQSFNKPTIGHFLVYLQPEPKKITENRNLSTYEFGGRIADCFNNIELDPQTCESSKDKARNFILDNWKHKKRAYIILEFNAVDNFSEYYVFIEPDSSGKWQIVWSQEFSDFDRGFAENISNTHAIDVKRGIADKDVYPFRHGYSILVFLDGVGNEIHQF
jgi:hypothetical protein